MNLQAELERIAADAPDHALGVAVMDCADERVIAALNADRPFQLASIFKVPVLVTAFRQAEAGRLDLDARHPLRRAHKLIGSGILAQLDEGLRLTLRDLLTLMIVLSDNTATDMVLELLGGVVAVQREVQALGIAGLHIRHTTRESLWAVFPSEELALSDAEIERVRREQRLPRHDERIAPDAPTNVGTARALATLLARLEAGRTASPASTAAMRTILARQMYNQRLSRAWPTELAFAHKTGTLGAMRGDAGIAYFPTRTVAVVALAEAQGAPLPLPPSWEQCGDALLARVGEAVWVWAR